MKVLLVSQNFYPENFKSNDIAFELEKRGFEVEVLTAIPNYPKGKYFEGYGIFKRRIERVNNVKVYRSFQFPRGKGGHIQLALNYFSFAFFASVFGIILSFCKKYDCIIVHQTSPVTQGFPAVFIKKIQKIPIYFWVLDLWPDALLSGGGLKSKHVISLFERIVRFMYENSKKILISSEGFRQSIGQKGEYQDKIIYFPNWSLDFKQMPSDIQIPSLPSGFVIMLAGNLGVSQDLEAVLNLAIRLKDTKGVRIVLIGDGSMKAWIDEKIIENKLRDILFTFGQFPIESMSAFYNAANAMLLTLGGKYEDLSLYVPARLQSYMSSGKPVLAMINGACKDLIATANCGYAVNAGDYSSLAKIIEEIILPDPDTFDKLGQNGRNYFEGYFRKDSCINNLCKIINK